MNKQTSSYYVTIDASSRNTHRTPLAWKERLGAFAFHSSSLLRLNHSSSPLRLTRSPHHTQTPLHITLPLITHTAASTPPAAPSQPSRCGRTRSTPPPSAPASHNTTTPTSHRFTSSRSSSNSATLDRSDSRNEAYSDASAPNHNNHTQPQPSPSTSGNSARMLLCTSHHKHSRTGLTSSPHTPTPNRFEQRSSSFL